MGHSHDIVDSDKHFIIDPVTRTIKPETPEKKKIMQYDHNSERYTFEIPRMIEGHDMSESDSIEIHYINVAANKRQSNSDVYEAEDMSVDEKDGEEILTFTWLISQNATQFNGSLNFAICFKCVDGDTVTYAWHTDIHTGVSVVTSITNGQQVIEEYSDILEVWRQRLFEEPNSVKDRILIEIEEKGAETLEGIPNDYATVALDSAESKRKLVVLENSFAELESDFIDSKDSTEEKLSKVVDGAFVENGYLFLTSNNEVVVGNLGPFSGTGGGGGSGSGNSAELKVTNTSGWLSKTVASNSDCIISINWSSIENEIATGNGVLKIAVNGIEKDILDISQGDVEVNVSKYLATGKNSVRIQVADVYDNIRTINFSINVVAISISSNFDASIPYSDEIMYSFTPVGSVAKTIHIVLDGEELGTVSTSTSGRQMSYLIPKQDHGHHLLRVYFTSEVNGQTIESNSIYHDLICIEPGDTTTIIASAFNATVFRQFESIVIEYRVYSPVSMTSAVQLLVDNQLVSSQTVDRTLQTWTYRADTIGESTLTIKCGEIERSFEIEVLENDISIEAETENLSLYLSSRGRSNNEANPGVWQYGDLSSILTGFNYKTNGWMMDGDKNTVLRLSGDARVEIPFKIFKDDFRTTGKTIEIEFATREVLNYDSIILSCLSEGVGIEYTAQMVKMASEQSSMFVQYKEDEHVRITFVVEKRSENRLIYFYINGIMSGTIQYPDNDDFSQSNPVNITLGSSECTLDIYSIRVYDNDLTRYQVLNNWIADTQNIEELLARSSRNDIFDDYGNIVISKLPNDLPYMVVRAAELPQSKGDKKTVSGYYVDPLNNNKSFTFEGAEFDVQGTSSAGYARKNYKGKFKKGFTLANGSTIPTYAMREDSIPTATFTFKADVASSEGANNVELVRLYNDTCPYKTVPQVANEKVRQGIDGFPMVIFWDDGENVTFLGKYNFNNDKGTPEVFGFVEGDESWEVRNNTSNRVLFKSDDFEGTDWLNDFEGRYPDGNTDPSNLKVMISWVKSTENDLEKFKAEFEDYFELNAMLYYYIFTETFLMVDSRAKNMFPTKMGGSKWFILPYDFDTAIGINNEGALAFGYNLEDIDTVEGADVFNGQQSILWKNFREAYFDDIKALYKTLRSGGIFSYREIEKRFEDHQAKWPEAIFNEDAYFKYIQPLIESGTSAYLSMLQGSKAEQRKWWLYNRFRYLDSKYNAGDSLADAVTLRGYAKDDITVVPYADIYASVKYGSYLVQKRATRNNTYTLECPLDNVNDTEIYIYNASQISSIGDVSGLMVGYAEFALADKLQELKIGDGSDEYSNPNLKELYLGNNGLLRKLDVRNCPNLTMPVDISGCGNIEEVYFEGTAITGLQLPAAGELSIIHLPKTITNLTITNQNKITDFKMEDDDYSNITTVRLENVSNAVPVNDIFDSLADNSRVRILGLNYPAASIPDFITRVDKMRGLDENGNNTVDAQISGNVIVPSVYADEIAALHAKYPNIAVIYTTLIPSYTVYFYDSDGSVLLNSVVVRKNANAVYPADTPKKKGYIFKGWSTSKNSTSASSTALNNITANKNVYAVWEQALGIVEYVERTITKADLGDMTIIPDYTFYDCQNLTQVICPNVVEIGVDAFAYTGVSPNYFVNLVTLGSGAFSSVHIGIVYSFPNLINLGSYAFGPYCQGAILPKVEKFVTNSIASNGNYRRFDLTKVTEFEKSAMYGSIPKFIIRNTEQVPKYTYNSSNPFYPGKLYVPRNLIDAYKSDSNWSRHASVIVAIEDYSDDGTVSGNIQ